MIKQESSSLQSWRSSTLDLVKLWAALTDIPAVSPRQFCWQVRLIFLKCQQADSWLPCLCSPTKCSPQNRSGEGIPKLRNAVCTEGHWLWGKCVRTCRRGSACGERLKKMINCFYSDFYRESKEREILSNGLLRFTLLWLTNWREQPVSFSEPGSQWKYILIEE